jgi:hypothetical protein
MFPARTFKATVTELGLTRKQVHEARAARDAERSDGPNLIYQLRATLFSLHRCRPSVDKLLIRREICNSFVWLAGGFDVVRFKFYFTDRAVPLNNIGAVQKESRPCVFSCFLYFV